MIGSTVVAMGGSMKTIFILLIFIIGIGTVQNGFAAERVVVCEELYGET